MALPKDVQDAVSRVDRSLSEWGICQQPWQIILANLLSQAAEIDRLQSRLAAANGRLETTERTLERCKQTLDTTSECWRLDAERLEAAERKILRLTAMRNEWERDAREHLMTFGQHLPASVECLVERFDAAIAAAQDGEG